MPPPLSDASRQAKTELAASNNLRSLYPVISPDGRLVERGVELERLDEWLMRAATSIAVVCGRAGAGKSTLLYQWLLRLDPSYKKLVCRVSSRHGTHRLPQYLAEVARALASVTGDSVPMTASAEELWLRLTNMVASFPVGPRVLLVLDGIDELLPQDVTFGPGEFLAELRQLPFPQTLRVVMTARTVPEWFNSGTVIGVGELASDDVLAMLTAGPDGMTPAQVAEVLRASSGDALLVALFRAAFVRDPHRPTWRPANLTPGDLRLPDLLRWWRDEQLRREGQIDADGRRELVRVLQLVARARGPVNAYELADVSGLTPRRVEALVMNGASYLLMGDARGGYTLAHPYMRRMFEVTDGTDPWLLYVEAAIARLDHDPSSVTPYVLHHAANHLCDAGDASQIRTLVTSRWRSARARETASPIGFIEDVQLILDWSARRAQAGDHGAMELSVRSAIALAASRPPFLPASAVTQLVRVGGWTTRVALSIVQQAVPDDQLAAALAELLPHDTVDLLVDAAMARAITRGKSIPAMSDRVRGWIRAGQAPRTRAAVREVLLARVGRDWPDPTRLALAIATLEQDERSAVVEGFLTFLVAARNDAHQARRAVQAAALSPRSSGGRPDEPLLVKLLENAAGILSFPLANEDQRDRLTKHALGWLGEIKHQELVAEGEAVISTLLSGSAAIDHAKRACEVALSVDWGMIRVFAVEQIRPLLSDPAVARCASELRQTADPLSRCLMNAGLLHAKELPEHDAIEEETVRLLGDVTDPFVVRLCSLAPASFLESNRSGPGEPGSSRSLVDLGSTTNSGCDLVIAWMSARRTSS